MATKQQVVRAADKLGITVEKEIWTVTLDAPTGYIMESNRCHCVCISSDPDWVKMPEVWAAALEEINAGIVECDDPECDICNDPEGG